MVKIPDGFVAERVASGRMGAVRWSIFKGSDKVTDSYVGDVVAWLPEGTFDFQPADPLAPSQEFSTLEQAIMAATKE